MNRTEPQNASTAIRKRLFNLLFQSFSAVIIIMVIVVLGIIFILYYRVINYYPPFRPILSDTLEAYYLGHGNWEGIELLVPREPFDPMSMDQNEWRDSVLLDNENNVILDHGTVDSPNIGHEYRLMPGDSPVPIRVSGRDVGILVVTRAPTGIDVLDTLALPFGTIVLFLGILTFVIGSLLSTRLVKPLSEVIAASRAMSVGNFSTRVEVEGPDDLRMLSDSFNQMAESLEQNDKNQRGLIADIAHELRTPLAVIQGKLEGIMDGIYPVDTAHVQPILEEAIRLENLISDLDVLTQADSNQLKFNITAIDLNQLAVKSIQLYETSAVRRQIKMRHKPEKNIPMAAGDPQRVSQVINNLVSNAIRYIPEKGSVTITTFQVEDGVGLRVCDNGPGIPEEDLPHIFDRFWRVDKSRSRDLGGAGLGLAIARQFIEIQGGRIFAENRPEGGLEIGFVLPLAKDDQIRTITKAKRTAPTIT